MIRLEPSTEQVALEESVRGTLSRVNFVPGRASSELWTMLGDLGIFGLGVDHFGGTTSDLLLAMRLLGNACLQGPILGAVLASRVLDADTHVELLHNVAGGRATAAVTDGSIAPWAVDADLVLQVGTDFGVAIVDVVYLSAFDTLASEPWCRVRTKTTRTLDARHKDLAIVELCRAAWLIGAAETLVDLAAAHARNRRQFGSPIGDFQAIAHPLASSAAELGAAHDAMLIVAGSFDEVSDVDAAFSVGRAAVRASLEAAYTSHQVHGALGFSTERGLDRYSTAIRQLSLHPPMPYVRTKGHRDGR